MGPRTISSAAPFLTMDYTVHLRVRSDLLGIARVIRLLKRHAVVDADVAIEGLSGSEVTRVRGTLARSHRTDGLAAALVMAPDVLHALILSDSNVIVEFSRRPPPNAIQ